MKLGEIKRDYPLLYKEVVANHLGWAAKTGASVHLHDDKHLYSAFTFKDTIQGSVFWYLVDQGRLDLAAGLCPELFIDAPEVLEESYEKWK